MKIEWQKTGSGKHRAYLPDSSMIIVEPNGDRWRWELVTPDGCMKTAVVDSVGEAKVGWRTTWERWVLSKWECGTIAGRHQSGHYLVPLS